MSSNWLFALACLCAVVGSGCPNQSTTGPGKASAKGAHSTDKGAQSAETLCAGCGMPPQPKAKFCADCEAEDTLRQTIQRAEQAGHRTARNEQSVRMTSDL